MQPKKYIRRVSCIDWDELRTRTCQGAAKRGDRIRGRFGADLVEPVTCDMKAEPGRFFFSPSDVPQIIEAMRRRFPDQARNIIGRAGRILEHRFDLLGFEGLFYGLEVDWHLDAVHGKRAPLKPWYKVRFLDFTEVGDHKVIWELSRHQWLLTLAKAYWLTGEEHFAKELVVAWYSWQKQNPYPIGVNWASSLEVAFRSLSWLWARYLLEDWRGLPERFLSDLLHALALNGRHIERYLSTYFAPNTHLLGEAVALFFIGVLCPEIGAADRWKQRGWQIIQEQASRQVLSDGLHFEQSTYYHVYALDLFLHAAVLASINDVPIPPEFDRTLEKMLDALCLLGRAGIPPRLGDDDGGRLFDPGGNRGDHLLDPLAAGAGLFGRGDFKSVAGE